MFLIHGTLTVLGKESGAVIAGITGIGHIGLTMRFLLFFLALRERVTAPSDEPDHARS
jgi:hypothetical protein